MGFYGGHTGDIWGSFGDLSRCGRPTGPLLDRPAIPPGGAPGTGASYAKLQVMHISMIWHGEWLEDVERCWKTMTILTILDVAEHVEGLRLLHSIKIVSTMLTRYTPIVRMSPIWRFPKIGVLYTQFSSISRLYFHVFSMYFPSRNNP